MRGSSRRLRYQQGGRHLPSNKISKGRCPGRGMIKTNIRGSLLGEGVINNCRKVCNH